MKLKSKLIILSLWALIPLVLTCNHNTAEPTNVLEDFDRECSTFHKGDFYWGKQCIKQRELLTCVKLLNEIKNNGIPAFFFSKIWFQEKVFMRYTINKLGEISIRSLGPEKMEIYKKKGNIHKKNKQYFFYTPQEGINNKEVYFQIKRIDCELDNSNLEKQGTFVMFTLSDGEKHQYGISPNGDPLIGYKNSEWLFKPEVLPNPEVWHKISLILSE